MAPSPASNYQFTVRSCLPGRIRWSAPGLVGHERQCQIVCCALGDLQGALTVKVSSLTGSILLTHELPWTRAALCDVLTGILSKLSSGDATPNRSKPSAATTAKPSPELEQWRGLTNELAKHPKLAWKALGTTFFERLFEASPPALISLTVDSVTRREASTLAGFGAKDLPSQLGTLVGLGSVIWTADSAMGYYRSIAATNLGMAVQQRLRDELYQHFQTLDLAQIENEVPGYWESVFRDDTALVARYLEQGMEPLVSILVNAGIVFVQLLRASLPLAMLQLLILPGIYAVSKALLPGMQKRRKLAHRADANLNALIRSNIQGISTIASFARETDEAQHVARAGEEVVALSRNAHKLTSAYVPLIQMVVGVGFLGTLAMSGMLVHRKRMVAGQVSMIGYSSLRLMTALGHLGVSIDNFQKASMAMQRINDFRNRAPQIQSGSQPLMPSEVRGELTLDRVTFAYSNEPPLFNGLSLAFPAGKTIGLVGLTGAGKSTLLKLLLRYYDILSGDIRLDGQSLRELSTQDLRRSIAYVPQQPFIFPGTVRENIAYSRPGASEAEVVAAAKLASAHDFIEQLTDGYETKVRGATIGGSGQALSGGQSQRLAIARAVLANTPIILFDEATSAVDNETEAAIQRSLHDFSAHRTTIIVAHRLSTVRRADLIYVLDGGAVRESGTHDELLALDGMYAGFWRVQTGESMPSAVSKNAAKSSVGDPSQKPKEAPSKPAVATQKPSVTARKVRASKSTGVSIPAPEKLPPKTIPATKQPVKPMQKQSVKDKAKTVTSKPAAKGKKSGKRR